MENDYDSTNDIQTEFDNYFCEDLTASDDEESGDDEIDSSNIDLNESDDVEEDSPETANNDLETLEQFTLQLEGDLANSILNDLSTAHLNLNAEQRGVLERCQNPVLKRLLLLNRLKSMHCLEFLKKIENSISVCKGVVKNIKTKQVRVLKVHVSELPALNVWKLGFPYFKTERYISPQYNADYFRKLANHELVNTTFTEGRRWIYDDQVALYDAICDGYLAYRKRMVEQQLTYVNSAHAVCPKDIAIKTQVDNLKNQLKAIKNETEYKAPPRDDETGIDWLRTINDFRNVHSEVECKAFWRIYLHPDINKSDWTKAENEKIHKLVEKYKSQNWDAIAKELNTDRTGFLVIVHYFSNLCDKFKRDRFTADEDERLLSAIDEHRLGFVIPWTSVAACFGGSRSKHQLYHRYTYYLEPGNVKKGAFTEAEDILLSYLVQQYGKSYTTIATYMSHRTGIQLRNRYSNYLEKISHNLGTFTVDDDKKIVKYVKENGESNWSQLAKQLERGRAHVRQRYTTIKKYVEKDPEMSAENFPRKKKNHFLGKYNERVVTLEIILDKMKDIRGIPTLKTVENYLRKHKLERQEKNLRVCRMYRKKEVSPIDQELVGFFKTICRVQRRDIFKPQEAVTDSANRVIKLLYLLGCSRKLFDSIDLLGDLPAPCNFDLLIEIKNLYDQQYLSKVNVAGPSSASFSFHSGVIKEILPPTVCTLVGLRGLVIKFDEFKESLEEFLPIAKSKSLESCTLESLPPGIDEYTKSAIVNDRNLFLERLVAIFKWPTILSRNDPSEQAIKCNEVEENVVEAQSKDEVVKVIKKKGRPKKPTYEKVKKMVEASKKKRNLQINDDAEGGTSKRTKTDAVVKYYPSRVKLKSVYERKNKSSASVPGEQPT